MGRTQKTYYNLHIFWAGLFPVEGVLPLLSCSYFPQFKKVEYQPFSLTYFNIEFSPKAKDFPLQGCFSDVSHRMGDQLM